MANEREQNNSNKSINYSAVPAQNDEENMIDSLGINSSTSNHSDTYDNLFKEQIPNICTTFQNGAQKLCRPSTITRKFPILKWLPKYKTHYIFRDMVAGFTVGLTTIPQAIAYGVVAGLEPQYGLYSAFMGCFMYIIFGSCKDVTIATTAIMALMVHDYAVISPDYPVFICFMAGCVILLLGLLNLGVLVRFISIPVITGFTLAAASTIGSAQINNLFGMKSPSNDFLKAWKHFFTHLGSIRINDAILGVCTLAFLILMKKAKDIPYGNRTFWKYVSLSRNALAVIIGTFLAYILSRDGSEPFRVTGKIVPGLPPFRLPPFSTKDVNGTEIPFNEMLSTVGTSFAAIPLVAILEIVAISKAFSKGKVVDASQEMIALGFCNIMGSFVLSMPVTGSFTRTAVNNASGVRTPLGGAVTGCLVLMALAFLTKTFYFIPKSTLAAVIIAAMISLVELNKIAEMWKSKKMDLFPFIVTTLTCIFWSLEYGILCGVGANLSFVLIHSARPQIEIYKEKVAGHEIGFVKIKQRLDYAAAEYLQEKILKFINKANDVNLIVIDGQEVNSIDYTVAKNVITIKEDLELLKCNMICYNWNIRSAGVICRLDNKLREMFRFNSILEEIVIQHYQQTTSVGSSSLSNEGYQHF